MTLRSFHLFFITISVLLSLFLGLFELKAYQEGHVISDALVATVAFAAAVGLAIYGVRFWTKSRQSAS